MARRNIIVKELPEDLQSQATRLHRTPEKVAPNSPTLEKFAQHLGVPLEEVGQFALAEPMTEKWLKKIRKQLASGTIWRGGAGKSKSSRPKFKPKRSLRRPTKDDDFVEEEDEAIEVKGNAKTPFAKLAASKGFTVQALADRLGVPHSYMWRVSTGNIARNHPVLVPLAKILSVEVPMLKRMMRRPVMAPQWHLRAQKDLLAYMEDRGRKRERSEPKTPTPAAPMTAIVKSVENGHPVEQRAYNRLGSKRSPLKLREVARALIATINVSVMRGDTHTPPLPLSDLYLVMQDYLQEKGIKANLLVDPAFGTSFDPK